MAGAALAARAGRRLRRPEAVGLWARDSGHLSHFINTYLNREESYMRIPEDHRNFMIFFEILNIIEKYI